MLRQHHDSMASGRLQWMSRAELEQELTARGVHDFVGEKDELQVCQGMFTRCLALVSWLQNAAAVPKSGHLFSLRGPSYTQGSHRALRNQMCSRKYWRTSSRGSGQTIRRHRGSFMRSPSALKWQRRSNEVI